MRFGFKAFVASVALAVGSANAATVGLSTAEHPQGGTSAITININILGLQTVSISNVGISGTGDGIYNLDASNSGINGFELQNGSLSLANVSQNFSGFLLSGSVQTIGVGATLTVGPEDVTNRNLTIDSNNTGALSLDMGTLNLTVTGGALYGTLTGLLGTNVVAIDLGSSPVSVPFSALGTSSVAATADDDETGLDPNGAEFNMPLAFAVTTTVEGIELIISTSGGLFLGSNVIVPEFGTFGLVSMAVAGLGGVTVYRRRRSA